MRIARCRPALLLGILVGMVLCGCSPYSRGLRLAQQGSWDAAAHAFAQALQDDPQDAAARRQLAYTSLRAGRTDIAVREFRRLLDSDPQDPFTVYHLGLAHLQEGRASETIALWERYRNPAEPLVEEELKRQRSLVAVYDSIQSAREALAREKSLQTRPPQPGSVAVFAYRDTSSDNRFRPLAKALAAMIVTDLTSVGSLTVIERLHAEALLAEMKLAAAGLTDPGAAPRAGRLLGAENIVVGTLGPGSITAKTSIASTPSETVKATFTVSTETESFFVLQKEIVFNILAILKRPLAPEEETRLRGPHTRSLAAAIHFGQGLEAWDSGRWGEARRSFSQALAQDPDFELARRYRDGCPAASSPTVPALSGMPAAALAAQLAADMGEVVAEQVAALAQTASGPGADPPAAEGSQPPGTGGISFSW